ncbi:hypothetical protein LX15_002858 [Streptoalloteichus tenebrarius]|uniref:Uncharacterized protein n=1 Tax=Streptoalloteichus tenebrarius (strain ATCC 17920 / DSM 40477 / JCM 4838 / CBS 697.72 / NBRC 16177 / NCIMB 11028 / NRRL B-12390 / A12253. 1 / ISP 5477) TaxID=1933 RepID=A0ABT1HUF8_STRSD|nr:phage tail sheath C-terminal domain-containing protein [Streptoalloteichus tenebrarius]MCP2259157.1 hypothetical protein [Streptoalloteichus tenebrarius]BFF04366.1 hypothetical protein GCM10020241_60410 [Streptoalloteichus tenebrarius]
MPVTPTYPGVYIEELPSRVRTITAVSTSVTAFVGYTARGPVHRPVTLTSFADFERRFGGLAANSPVSYAVHQFFLNGGGIAVVVRVASGAEAASVVMRSRLGDQPGTALTVTAREPGTWGNGLRVAVDHATPTPDGTFNLQVSHAGGSAETFTDLSMDPAHPRYVVDVVNAGSTLVTVASGGDPRSRPEPVGTLSRPLPPEIPDLSGSLEVAIGDRRWTIDKLWVDGQDGPKPRTPVEVALLLERKLRALPDDVGSRTFGAARVTAVGRRLQVVAGAADPATVLHFGGSAGGALGLEGSPNVTAYALGDERDIEGQGKGRRGKDGAAPRHTDLIGTESGKTGLHALRDVEDVNLLALPEVCEMSDDHMVAVLAAADRLCRDKRMVLLVDSPSRWRTLDAARAGLPTLDVARSDHAALYFPHLHLADPLTGRLRAFPPCGAVAGIMARTDGERGVWKAPAGTEARLAGVRALTVPMTDPENGLLNPLGVNCLRSFPVVGPVVWGARTMAGADVLTSQWKYLPVRRTALMLEESLYRGTKWVVFEPNDERLWSQIRLNVGAFLHGLFQRGAFQGASARDAYFVKCDAETTTQNDVNSGVVNVVVGFAPLRPAEFVIIKIEQMAGRIEA